MTGISVAEPSTSAPESPARRSTAVALQDTAQNAPDSHPKIIASGYGELAEQIVRMAFERGIKVRQDADLAELLASMDLDTPIPSEAIVAVAEILAKVYEANGGLAPAPAAAQSSGNAAPNDSRTP
ncbi:MAG: EscU/YscU/HrcU family type III secretion system export apparatus switch protein [Alphaproteobacteria bacterium]|nr:EscU/YscU/HrcU family type III secretion system export apparatus switch protein [Alphaproteobacteria bacterium]